MAPVLPRERLVLDPAEYRRLRPARRAELIPLRRLRRVRLGDMLTVEFENEATLLYQVQEMLYVESAGHDVPPEDVVADELAAYARLLPGPDHLVATLFIELDDPATVREELARLDGIQHCLHLDIGGTPARGVEVPGRDETGSEAGTVSVHVLRFDLDAAQRRSLGDPATPVALTVRHPRYAARTELGSAARQSLGADLHPAPAGP